MSQVSRVLRRGGSRYFLHWCPACNDTHPLWDSWHFDGNVDRPSFQPSFKQSGVRRMVVDGRWTGEWVRDAEGKTVDGTCHYIIANGQIHFCPDSWHGRTDIVDMPDLPEGAQDD